MKPTKITISILLYLTLFFTVIFSMAQVPEKVSYQSVIRDATGELVRSQIVGIQISILQGTAEGNAFYVETHTPSTNMNGLVTIEVGFGTSNDTFSEIDWSNSPYFLKVETDLTGGTTYTITGTSEILSVPYALHAKTVESVPQGIQTGEMLYWDGSAWVTVEVGNEGQVLTFIGGVPTWRTEVGDNFVINFSTGKIWMDRNLGASQVADSITDVNAYGDLYQWGRAADGHQIRTSDTISILSTTDTPGHSDFIITNAISPSDWRNMQNDNLWQGVNGVNNPCPSAYRLPTAAEFEAERLSWSSNNSAGAFASPLKLPLAGSRDDSIGSIDGRAIGLYWSSNVDSISSKLLVFESEIASMISKNRASGNSVRCIKE